MSKQGIAVLIVAVVLVVGGGVYFAGRVGSSPAPAGAVTPGVVAGAASSTNELFAGSVYAAHAYLISTNTFDASTKLALTGFTVQTSTNADGSTQITLHALDPKYKTQTFAVKPGEKLYFIEGTMQDDIGDTDSFPNDDSGVLVDSNGYIVQVGSASASLPGKG